MRSFRLLIFSALFSFFAVYTVIWSILEPFPIPDHFQLLRWTFIIGLSTLLVIIGLAKRGFMSYLCYRYIRPLFINKLQFLSTHQTDDSLSEGWELLNQNKEMHPKLIGDILFGKVCSFEDSNTHDAFHGIKVIAKEKGKKIDYFLKPTSESSDKTPVIYIRVEVRNIVNPVEEYNEYKWLKLVIDKVHNAESSSLGEVEETIYIKSKATFMDWMFFSEDIQEIIKRIKRWEKIYVFNKLDGIKVRGSLDLGSIMIYA